jgi:hypothetical protein
MRKIRIIAVAITAVLGVAGSAAAQERWSLDPSVGPSFGTIGTTFAAAAAVNVPVTNGVSVVGEFGALPDASARDAEALFTPLPDRVPNVRRARQLAQGRRWWTDRAALETTVS